MKNLLLYIFLFSIIKISAQSYNFDVSLATDTENKIFIYNASAGIGHSFTDNDYFYSGAQFQLYDFAPHYFVNLELYSGMRYAQPIMKTHKGRNLMGIFPDLRLYFSPYIPRRFVYYNNSNERLEIYGDYACQFAYGIGFGIFLTEADDGDVYFALRFEYNTIDAFQSLRKLKFKDGITFDFPRKNQFVIELTLFVW